MDVLVQWEDGTKNTVHSSELKSIGKRKIKVGSKVKMLYIKKWYTGTVLDMEMDEILTSDDSEDISLAQLIKRGRVDTRESDSSEDVPLQYLVKGDKVELNSALDILEKVSTKTIYSSEQQLPEHEQQNQQIVIADEFNPDEGSTQVHQPNMEQVDNDQSASIVDNVDGHDFGESKSYTDSSFLGDISDREDPTYVQTCVAKHCKREVFSACHLCLKLLCYEHFQEYTDSCTTHNKTQKDKKRGTSQKTNQPEDFTVEGESKENDGLLKKSRVNKFKLAKKLRDMGKEYISTKTGATVPARKLKEGCNSNNCKKQMRECSFFNEEQRIELFTMFTNLGNLTRQREYIVRHIEVMETATKTTKKEQSRRQRSRKYYLTLNHKKYLVCKTFFLHTLGISEKTMRTALAKLTSGGIVEEEKRGGRQSVKVIERDRSIRAAISNHIQRFPKVEAHYCRASSSREYLHPELTVSKMYNMYIEELGPNEEKPSIDLYRKIFRSLNLSFHRAKKDQCSLCLSYRQGDEVFKDTIRDKYNKHIAEKTKVREIKKDIKEKALANDNIVCASFDLQQVIYLPQSKENALFYKRRLANYNFTFYDIASKECHCFIWSELCSQMGVSEIGVPQK